MVTRRKGKRGKRPEIKVIWEYVDSPENEEAVRKAFKIIFQKMNQGTPDQVTPGVQLKLW